MVKKLGGMYRNIRVVNGNTSVIVKAVVPTPLDAMKAKKICELNGWEMTPDTFGNLTVTTTMTFNANRMTDRTLMDSYIGFAEKVASALVGYKNRYPMAGVLSYDAAV